ncbi:SHOCT domain-containing protein [Metaclostridioides mangenotii]|uniref:SHOCT domain-containing protein n=1 Tax=Metaclostridioides mangenotii TaxID=1540 RepID=UPI0009DEB496|nr:SHOCT domain-containing protein [Clostridioides mangenotii]
MKKKKDLKMQYEDSSNINRDSREQTSENVEHEKVNNLEQIKILKELLDMGAITENEFNSKKKELLGV